MKMQNLAFKGLSAPDVNTIVLFSTQASRVNGWLPNYADTKMIILTLLDTKHAESGWIQAVSVGGSGRGCPSVVEKH